jgi:predicted phage tail protein
LFHAKYTIQISKKSNLSTFVLQRPSIDSTTYTPTLPDGLYYWHVRAVNSFGISEWSSAFSFSIDTLAPQAPILKAPKTGSVTIGLPVISWNTSKTAVEYRVAYSKTNYPTNPENISNWIKTTSFTPTAMDMMVPYYWFVQARDTAGNVSPWSAAWTVKVVPPVPAKILINAPLNKTITGIGETSIAWNPVSYGNIYEVQISQSALFKTIDFSYKTDKGVTSITTGSLKPGGWNIRIRAINLNNVAGPWSNVNSFTINQ